MCLTILERYAFLKGNKLNLVYEALEADWIMNKIFRITEKSLYAENI